MPKNNPIPDCPFCAGPSKVHTKWARGASYRVGCPKCEIWTEWRPYDDTPSLPESSAFKRGIATWSKRV